MFASTAAAVPGVNSNVKTGFYVYDGSKIGQEYSYYSIPYALTNITTFLPYKDGFADNSKFIWVNSAQQFVSMTDWANGPADITNIVTDLGSATYYDVENAQTINLALGVQATVSNPSKTGFSLALSREVAGLVNTDLTIKDSSNVDVAGVALSNPSNDNKNFTVTYNLTPGETYTLTIDKTGFYFGEAVTIDVPTEVIIIAATPVTNQGKTGFTLNLGTALDGITFAGNFKLQDQYGNEISITSATSTDGGNTYIFTTGNMIRERTYTLTPINGLYSLSSAVSFIIAPQPVTTTIQNVTVNNLVVNLSPGVDNIPSANFYLRDSNNNRLLSMILATAGSPATDYTIGAFPYLIAGSQYSIEVSMPEYDFGGAKTVSPGQTDVTMSVPATPTTTGFTVKMIPAVPGLTASNFSLKNSQNSTVPFSVSTPDGGTTYNFAADIIAGSSYTISAVKNGFNFGTAQNVLAPVVVVGAGVVNGTIQVYLNGVLGTVPAAADFTITQNIDGVDKPNVTPTAVSQNTTTRILTLTVPQVAASGADQLVTGTIKYGDMTKNYTFTVPSSPVPVAAGIISIDAPAQDATTLTLPSVPAGFTVAIKSSSNTAVIATDGTIVPPASTTTVNLVLTVTKTAGGTTADTASIAVVVPGSPTTVANNLTITHPAAGATSLTLPTVPAEYTVAIKSSDNTSVIALDKTITPPFVETNVVLTLEVTKTDGGSKAVTGNLTVIVSQAPAITAINTASTGAAMQIALPNASAFLTLTSFNALSSADKLTAANAVLSNRPAGGYATQAALQAALDNAVTNVENYNAVAAAKGALAIGYAAGDSAAAVTQNLTLSATQDGVTVSWESDKTNIDATTGAVTRPSFTTGNVTVTLTATLTKGAAKDTKTFTVVVTKLPQTEAEAVVQLNVATTAELMQTAITNTQLGLTLTEYNKLTAADKTTVANVILTGKPAGGYADKTAVQTALDAAVTNIVYLNALAAAKTTAKGELTAELAVYKQADYSTANWTALTTAKSNGDTAIDTAADIAAVGTAKATALSAMEAIKTLAQEEAQALAQLNAATTVVEMQTAITNTQLGFALTEYNKLTATDQTNIANTLLNGKPYADKIAVQTAIDAAVANIVNMNIVAAAKSALVIGYVTGDSEASVTQNITLITEQGGVTISWASENAAITNNGAVTRPAFTTGDVTGNLIATLTKGAASDTKTFSVTVIKLPLTAAEVAAAISIAAPAKDATTLTLPTVPGFSIAIQTSDNEAVIALDGKITPPDAATTVALVLEVTRTSDNTKASTTSINVVVPAKTPVAAFSEIGTKPSVLAIGGGYCNVTMQIEDFANAASKFDGVTVAGLQSEADVLAFMDNGTEIVFTYTNIFGDIYVLQANFTSPTITSEALANAVLIYKK